MAHLQDAATNTVASGGRPLAEVEAALDTALAALQRAAAPFASSKPLGRGSLAPLFLMTNHEHIYAVMDAAIDMCEKGVVLLGEQHQL